MNVFNDPRSEFWFHVASQEDIPLAGSLPLPMNIPLLFNFIRSANDYMHSPDNVDASFKFFLTRALIANINYLDVLRTLVGVSNKRLYLELSLFLGRILKEGSHDIALSGDSIYNLSKHDLTYIKRLCRPGNESGHLVCELISDYLLGKELEPIVLALNNVPLETFQVMMKNMVLTKEVQQREAKLRGHGAEQVLAKLLRSLGVAYIPDNRDTEPMASQDPNVTRDRFSLSQKIKGGTWSFDLILCTEDALPFAFVQSLIHTSDPGQYGVNKSDESVLIHNDVAAFNAVNPGRDIEHWGLVDGFGFSENKRDTIDKMLEVFDVFVQINTMYKAALHLHKRGLCSIKAILFDDDYYNRLQWKGMRDKYVSPDVVVLNEAHSTDVNGLTAVEAGKAVIYF